jgi:ATP-dependent Lhr-like helicase
LSSGPTQVVGATPIALFLRANAGHWYALRSDEAAERSLEPAATVLSEPARRMLDHLRARGASFAQELRTACSLSDQDCRAALGELVAEGLIASDGFAGLRAIAAPSSERRFNVDAAGRWSAIVPLMSATATDRNTSRDDAVKAFAWTLLSRYGVVFRRLLTREVGGVTWRELVRVYRMLEARGGIRGGRFVSGMSGEQYASPDAVERLRELRRSGPDEALVAISGADPLNLTGIVTRGDRVRAAASSRIVYRNGVPVMAMEGDMLRTLADADAAVLADAAAMAAGRRVPVSHGYVGRIWP